MLYNYSTSNLTGLQDLMIKKVDYLGNFLLIDAEIERKPHQCPCCGTITDKVHDYRVQTIKDIPAFGNFVLISLRKRRYVCEQCKKRFYENVKFLPQYHKMTNRLSALVIYLLEDICSFSSVAREVNLFVSTVIRIFDIKVNDNLRIAYELKEMLTVIVISDDSGIESCTYLITKI